MTAQYLRLLGRPELQIDDKKSYWSSGQIAQLLLYLAYKADWVNREQIIFLLWPDKTDDVARLNLRRLLSRAKKQVAGVESDGELLRWIIPSDIQNWREALDKQDWEKAFDLYQGPFLEAFDVGKSVEFANWLEQEREELLDAWRETFFDHMLKLQKENPDKASELIKRFLALDPLNELTLQSYLKCLAATGQYDSLERVYQTFARRLDAELGLEPSEETQSLLKQLKDTKVHTQQLKQPSETQDLPTRLKLDLPKDLTPPAFLTEAGAGVKETLFVGRTEELNLLQEALDSIGQNKGQVRLLLGSAGQGKSHLLQKFASDAQKDNPDLLVLTGYCDQQSGVGDPYLPFRHILLLLLGDVEAKWQGGLISTEHAKRLWEAMAETVPQIAKHAPDLISSFPAGKPLVERLVVAGLDKETWFTEVLQLASEKPLGTLEQARIISLYASALQAIAEIRPILLILEDLHWVDASSAALFNYLSRHIVESRILLIGSYRPTDLLARESQHPILEMSGELHRLYGNISINLEEKKIEEERGFVNSYLDSEPNELGSSFREIFFKHTQGHALFTAELLGTMKDRGDLYQKEGKWFAKDKIDWHTLPAKVEGVIEVRIGRLPNEQRELLSVASVQGEVFVGEAIAQVQKQNELEVIRTLSGEIDKRHQLVQSERMERLGKQRLSHYRFRHNLFQKYVYSNLAETERTYLHEDIALALEEMYSDQAKNIAPQLAWHFEQAGNFEKAFEYLLTAGQQAQALGSNKEAIIHYERGLATIKQLPSTPELIPLELGFQVGFGMALLPVEGFQSKRVKIALERALELCRQIGPNPQLMPIYSGLSYYAFASDDSTHRNYLELAREFETIAREQEDVAHLAQAELGVIIPLFLLGENDKTIDLGRLALSHIHFDQESHKNMIRHYTYDQRPAVWPLIASALIPKGKIKEAKAFLDMEFPFELKHSASLGFFLASHFTPYRLLGNAARVKSIAEELAQLANDYGYAFWQTWSLLHHGWALTQLGEVETGVNEMQQTISVMSMAGGLISGSNVLALLAEGLWLMGKHDEALVTIEKSFAHAQRKDELFCLSQLNLMKGQWLQELGADSTKVERCFRQAIDVAQEQNACLLELQATLSLVKYWQANKKEQLIHPLLTELLDRITPIIDAEEILEYAEANRILSSR